MKCVVCRQNSRIQDHWNIWGHRHRWKDDIICWTTAQASKHPSMPCVGGRSFTKNSETEHWVYYGAGRAQSSD